MVLLIGLILFLPAKAQDLGGVSNYHNTDSLFLAGHSVTSPVKISPWKVNTSLGTSFYYAPGYGAGTSLFAAPHLDFSATDRLTLHSGFIASHYSPLYRSLREDSQSLASFTNLSMFVAASYRVSRDLVIYGSGMKSLVNPGITEMNSAFSMDDFSIGAAYSIGNFTIGASFHSGSSAWGSRSPFHPVQGVHHSPFYW